MQLRSPPLSLLICVDFRASSSARRSWWHRQYSAQLHPSPRSRIVQIPVGGSGSIFLNVIPVVRQSSSSSNNVLVYFPPGHYFPRPLSPSSPTSASPNTIPSLLSSLLPTTNIITVNYRLNPLPSPHTFPVPIHDAIKAFDYIVHKTAYLSLDGTPLRQRPKISLYGSHIGGLLATTLALTEPTLIHSVALSEPIVDWVSLGDDNHEEALSKRKSKQVLAQDGTSRLVQIRNSLFRKPETYFDAFASPILFLRAPARDCPRDHPDPLASLVEGWKKKSNAFGPYDDDLDSIDLSSENSSSRSSSYSSFSDDVVATRPIKRRKVLQRWPPTGRSESTLLPQIRVFVQNDDAKGSGTTTATGEESVLRGQGEELVDLMRRVCFYGQQCDRESGYAESRVGLEKIDPTQQQDLGDGEVAATEVAGVIGVRQAAQWLEEKFQEGDWREQQEGKMMKEDRTVRGMGEEEKQRQQRKHDLRI